MDAVWCVLSFAPLFARRMYPGNLNILIISMIFEAIIFFCFCDSLAKKFNKGIGYTIGLFLLNPIFIAILTFNKKCYYYRGW